MKKTKDKKIKLFLGCIILMIFIVLIIGIYYFNSLKTKPREVFISTIDGVLDRFTKQENLNSIVGNINVKTNLTSDDDTNKMLNIINNIDGNLKFGIDYNNNVINTIFSSNYDNGELLNASTSLQEDGVYINLEGIYAKTIMIPIKKHNNYVSVVFNQTDIKTILMSLRSAIDSSLQDKYFVRKNTKISLNGEDIKVIKNTLTLNNSNLNKIINDVKVNLNNNDEFLNSLSQISNETKEEIKNKIDSVDHNGINEIITISLYTKDNKVIGFEIAKTSNTGLTLSLFKTDKTNYSYEIKNSVSSYKGNLEINRNGNSIDLTIFSGNNKINGTIVINIDYDRNKDIEEFIKNDIVNIEDISDQERIEIFNNLQQRQSIRNLIKNLWNLIEI